MKKLICFLLGHQPVKGLYEDSEIISSKGCKRCGAALLNFGNMHWKSVRNHPCPGKTKEYWEDYCSSIENELRKKYIQQ